MTTFLAFSPQPVSASAEVTNPSRFQSLDVRILVHIGQHKHGATTRILGDRGN